MNPKLYCLADEGYYRRYQGLCVINYKPYLANWASCRSKLRMLTKFENKTLYEILGVSPEASKLEIDSAYQDLCRIYHPDSNFYHGIADDAPNEKHAEIYELIKQAYHTLINDDSRVAYDNKIFLEEHKNLFPRGFPDVELQQSSASTPAPRGVKIGESLTKPILVKRNQTGPRPLSPRETKAKKRKEQADVAWAQNFPSMSQIIFSEQHSLWRTIAITLLGGIAGAAGGVVIYKVIEQFLKG